MRRPGRYSNIGSARLTHHPSALAPTWKPPPPEPVVRGVKVMGSTSFCSSSGCRPPTPRLQTRGPGASGQHLGAQPADLIDHLIQALAHGRLQPPWGARRPQRTPWRPETEPLRAPKGAEPPREGGDLPKNRRSHPICHRLIARPPGHLARAMGLECPRALEALWSHKKADIHTERSPRATLQAQTPRESPRRGAKIPRRP